MQWLVPQLQLRAKGIGIAEYDVRVHFESSRGGAAVVPPCRMLATPVILHYYTITILCNAILAGCVFCIMVCRLNKSLYGPAGTE